MGYPYPNFCLCVFWCPISVGVSRGVGGLGSRV